MRLPWAGTLVHEMSHFDVTGYPPYFYGTVDVINYSYKQSLARQLAIEDPSIARGNASNIEYFTENTPYEP
jgi:peptidyl-Lys metalloendopeptidase